MKKVAHGEVTLIERAAVDPLEIEGSTYVSLEDIDSITGQLRLVTREPSRSAKFRFGPEHVLYGKLRPYLQKVARPEVSGFCSTDILPIRPTDELDRNYLFHFLRTPEVTAKATQAAVGINLPRSSPSVLSTFHIPLPPLSGQRRIAEILDKADALRAKRRAALKKLDDLAQAIFLDMFGDPATNPKGWPRLPISEVTDGASNWNPNSLPDTKFVYIDIAAIDQVRKCITGARPMLGREAPSRARQLIRAGDVLVSTVRPNLNAVARVPDHLDGATASTGFCVLRPREGRIKSDYLFALVRGVPSSAR